MSEPAAALSPRDHDRAEILERVLLSGDLSRLSPAERVLYYRQVCESLGLNPLTRPFDYITLNGKLVLYAKRDATDQLRRLRRISVTITSREQFSDLYLVTARACDGDGRTDDAIGAVSIANLKGDALANAIMKCETKAKRRVTLSICGLGWLDETEAETVHDEDESGPRPDEASAAPEAGPSAGPTPPAAPRMASLPQRRLIHSLWKGKHQLPEEALRRWIAHRYQVSSTGELTEARASEIITLLQKTPTDELASGLAAIDAPQGEAGAADRIQRAVAALQWDDAALARACRRMFGTDDLGRLTAAESAELARELAGIVRSSRDAKEER